MRVDNVKFITPKLSQHADVGRVGERKPTLERHFNASKPMGVRISLFPIPIVGSENMNGVTLVPQFRNEAIDTHAHTVEYGENTV
jgi:hypothetical protein